MTKIRVTVDGESHISTLECFIAECAEEVEWGAANDLEERQITILRSLTTYESYSSGGEPWGTQKWTVEVIP